MVLPLLVVLGLGTFLAGAGLYQSTYGGCRDSCCGGESAEARAGQITTMVVRFNQFKPNGAEPIVLGDGYVYSAEELAGLVAAGYCANTDLTNQNGGHWIWRAITRKFEPENQKR